jgi:ATP-dependent Clp protease ATP-binding subunit ClpB
VKMLEQLRNGLDAMRSTVDSLISRLVVATGGASWHSMSEVARKVYYDAVAIAERYGHSEITLEHLLLAILHQKDGVARRLFEEMRVDFEKMRQRMEQHLSSLPAGATRKRPTLSPRARQATLEALGCATRRSERWVGSHHLLYGILSQPNCFAAQILREIGLSEDRLRPYL